MLQQLQTLRAQLGTETDLGLNDVVVYLRKSPSAVVDYFSEVFNLVKLLLVVPAVSECSASVLRRLKTFDKFFR